MNDATTITSGTEGRAGRARPQLTLEELQQIKWLLGGVLTLLSVWTVFYLDVEAWTWTGLTSAGVIAVLVRPAWPARIPRWVHRLAFPAIVAIFAGDLWLTGEVLPAMVRLDILLLLYRGITYRQKRDDLQVIVLGLFLVVVAGVLTVSLAFAVQILAFTGCALAFLLAITLVAADGGDVTRGKGQVTSGGLSVPALTRPAAGGAVPGWARQVEWRRLLGRVRAATDWRVVALGAGLFAGLVAMSALLFLAIPRFQLENSFFLERFITKKARTGFSDTIRFGDVTEIQQDNSVALSVDVADRARIPAVPYWRMLVLDEYRDGTFRLSAGIRRTEFTPEFTRAIISRPPRSPEAERNGDAPDYWTFYLEAGVSRYLPLLGAFDELRFREAQRFRLAPDLGLVALRDDPVTMTAYRVEHMATGATLRDEDFARRFRKLEQSPRAATALMLRLDLSAADRATLDGIVAAIEGGGAKGGTGIAVPEFARRTEAWLAKRHGYSLKPAIPGGSGDPLVLWLAGDGAGHCELFAGAMVLLARSAGIPARVVTGFKGGSWNGYSNNFTLRNSDAHAWCELFDAASESWVRADPTPGAADAAANTSEGDAALARRIDRSWTARLDSLRVFWYRRIVNFDQQSQLDTLKSVKEATEASGRRVREALRRLAEALRSWVTRPWHSARSAVGLAVVAAVLAGAVWAAMNRRWLRFALRLGSRARQGDAVRIEAGRWLVRLRAQTRGERQETGDAVIADLQRLRFGARETWGEPLAIFRHARMLSKRTKRSRLRTTA
ncbi:MAG TPA: DUF3488 and transglutaminase-like domain-containing protein [Opitutus sp.]|nr:DUF3488 and transglutaminase-like domain-containing protein [Opitutus sp.]